MDLDVWGPRTGKTTSRAIPAILEAPGAVLITSNKRDVVDVTRGPRQAAAGRVWVFDPQGICAELATWWWDPLSYVTDEVKAQKLAEHFAAGSRDPGARTDAYFDPAGQDLLGGMLLAAALDRRPITQVYTWLTRPTDEEAVDILREHGYDLTADQVAGVVLAPDRQRGGVFGTAQQMASCLTNRQIARWVTHEGPAEARPQLDPVELVRDGGTLYSLSKEGRGTAGPLVTALTVAVVEAAEELAVQSPGGRLATPLLGVLDEAANVCRWRELPNLYSHYGSRGIVLMTILQSWSQGVDVWGESGMKKLWSAANIKCYGGGVSEAAFLEDLSRMVGEYDRESSSLSVGRGHRTVSRQLQRERILDVADLAAMPKGRALVLASGSRPALIRTQPWMNGPARRRRARLHHRARPPRRTHHPRSRNRSPDRLRDACAGAGAMTDTANSPPGRDDWGDEPADDSAADTADEDAPQLYYGSVDEFVREYLRCQYRRRIDGQRRVWSAQWWKYGEAISRLDALWHAWEHHRLDPATGASIWWRDHADHHMPALMDPDGTFHGVKDTNNRYEPLPYAAPPEGLFPDEQER
ncbi:TraM recognition domain-containing protein [Georgenia halophila]